MARIFRLNRVMLVLALAFLVLPVLAACSSRDEIDRTTPTSVPFADPSPTATVVPTIVATVVDKSESEETPEISPTPVPTTTTVSDGVLPEGWSRLQVREGFIARNAQDPLAGFTIDLPPGWIAGESWPGSLGFSGWIAAPSLITGDHVPSLRFYVGSPKFRHLLQEMQEDERSVVTFPVVEGQDAILYLANLFALNQGPQVGIFFEHIPGGEPDKETPSLSVDGDARGFVDQEQLARVLTSIRYSELSALPQLPSIDLEPVDDWVRTPARTDWNAFSMLLPPDWKFEEEQGSDTLVGTLSNGDISLRYDFGGFAGRPYSPGYNATFNLPDPGHLMWEEDLLAGKFTFVRPESPLRSEFGVTGVFVKFANPDFPKLPAATISGLANLGFRATGLDGDEQAIVLTMLRTLELERDPITRK